MTSCALMRPLDDVERVTNGPVRTAMERASTSYLAGREANDAGTALRDLRNSLYALEQITVLLCAHLRRINKYQGREFIVVARLDARCKVSKEQLTPSSIALFQRRTAVTAVEAAFDAAVAAEIVILGPNDLLKSKLN